MSSDSSSTQPNVQITASTLSSSRSTTTLPHIEVENGLRVCSFNANSLKAHINSLKHYLLKNSHYHLIAVTETKLGPYTKDSDVALQDYTIIRQDRRTSGGGVALYVHNSLSVSRLCSSSGRWTGKPGFPEYLFCEVTPKHGSAIFVGVVYRPPYAPFLEGDGNNFMPDLVNHMHNYGTKVITGDFNADQLSSSDDEKYVRDLVAENALYMIPYGATFHRHGSDTALDLCLINAEDIVLDYHKSDVPFSDAHDLITATIQCSLVKPARKDFTYRDYKALDKDRFLQDLSDSD